MTIDKRKEKIIIERFDDEFNGIAYEHGKRFVVPKTLPKEKVLIEERSQNGNVVVCKVDKVLLKDQRRIESQCPYYNECGGCNLLHISYENQLKLKTELIERKFATLGYSNIDACVGNGIKNYRNKAHIVFAKYGEKVRAGFFNEETHGVIDVEECLCHGEWYKTLRSTFVAWINRYNITIYNPKTMKGIIRFAVARYYKKNLMLTLVVTKLPDVNLNTLYDMLIPNFKEIVFYANINNKPTNEVLAGDFKHINGEKSLKGQFCNMEFRLSPDSFFQINSIIAEKIYREILKEINATETRKVIDLFSGIGITSVLFAKSNKRVESIEIEKSAVNDAIELSKINNVNNIKFNCGDCAKILPKIKDMSNAIFFVDPPRKGLGKSVCSMITAVMPQEILYLSCNINTMVDDIKYLMEKGYKIKRVTPYDMFAGSKHVETLAYLEKNIDN